jgi:hypothetical protein
MAKMLGYEVLLEASAQPHAKRFFGFSPVHVQPDTEMLQKVWWRTRQGGGLCRLASKTTTAFVGIVDHDMVNATSVPSFGCRAFSRR